MKARLDITSGWLGYGLAGLFFYPLASALSGDPYYLQWQPSHGWWTLAALALLALALAVIVRPVLGRDSRGSTGALALVALLPLLSLGAGVSRQVPFGEALRRLWEVPTARYGLVAATALALAVLFVAWPVIAKRALERCLQVLSPIAVVVTITIAQSVVGPATPIETNTSGLVASRGACPSVLALLFDEFSAAYLYDGTDVRPEFPNLRKFGAQATHYHAVRSPGPETLSAVPGYLAGRTFDAVAPNGQTLLGLSRGAFHPVDATQPDGLLPTARRVGLAPHVIGYYLAYCSLVGSTADTCRSFSFYNRATVRQSRSLADALADPLLTTVILWPRQFPLGILKGWAFGQHQRALVDATLRELSRSLAADAPVFRLVHFSIPHLPFVFSEQGYDPPWDPFTQRPDVAYEQQLRYADRVFGEVVDRLARNGTFARTTVVFFSDHGFRGGGRETDVRRVPFLVKRADQTDRHDVTTPAAGEHLLREVVVDACSAT